MGGGKHPPTREDGQESSRVFMETLQRGHPEPLDMGKEGQLEITVDQDSQGSQGTFKWPFSE